jgi:hypothetical protein
MADFVAVLRKTIGGLGDTTPAMRDKVFDKARSTIEAKLAAIQPPPPAAAVERQRKALEDAIAVVRAEFDAPAAPEAPEANDTLDDIFAEFDRPSPPAPLLPSSAAVAAPPRVPEPAPEPEPEPAAAIPAAPQAAAPAASGHDELHAPVAERLAGDRPAQRRATPDGAQRRPRRGLLAAALALVALLALGGGYLWWSGQLGPSGPSSGSPVAVAPAQDPAEPAATTAEDLAATPPDDEAGAEAPAGQAAAEPEPAPEVAAGSPEKFTQRLLPDGSEVDEGPSGGQPGIGEGSSIASAAQPAVQPPAGQPPAGQPRSPAATPASAQEAASSDTESAAAAGEDAASVPGDDGGEQAAAQPASAAQSAGQAAAVAVGQRAIFYEERTSASEGSAEVGSIAWSLVQESPGGDLPPEPAIRAEATVPGKDVQLRMTIRRNGDQTLPASHIVEMIFLTPEGFEGGTIANVAHVAFKDTEQAPGRALIGIPAKIADGFFLIALSDAPAETQANLGLLQRQSWLDIPIVYQTGRRALLSMEKGIPGERVFQEALRAWSEASSG